MQLVLSLSLRPSNVLPRPNRLRSSRPVRLVGWNIRSSNSPPPAIKTLGIWKFKPLRMSKACCVRPCNAARKPRRITPRPCARSASKNSAASPPITRALSTRALALSRSSARAATANAVANGACPADTALGLEETAGYSPAVQEMAALLASKMPVEEASVVLERLTGVKLPRATLDREARRQGQRAQRLRSQLDQQAATQSPTWN